MAKRKYVDWDSIEPLYRQGHLSNYEICRQYAADHVNSQTWKITVAEAAIRKQAKAKGWEKDLAGKVRRQVKENVVRSQVRNANQNQKRSDQEIVDQAAEAGSNVVLRHQREITSLSEVEGNLLEELRNEKDDKTSLKDKSIILKNIAHVRAQRIALERQAHNLDDDSNKGAEDIFVTVGDE